MTTTKPRAHSHRASEAERKEFDRAVLAKQAIRIKKQMKKMLGDMKISAPEFCRRGFSDATIHTLSGEGLKFPEELLVMSGRQLRELQKIVGAAAHIEIEQYRERFKRKPVKIVGLSI